MSLAAAMQATTSPGLGPHPGKIGSVMCLEASKSKIVREDACLHTKHIHSYRALARILARNFCFCLSPNTSHSRSSPQICQGTEPGRCCCLRTAAKSHPP